MGLYINNDKDGTIYKNEGPIMEPNQSYFKRDHFEELVKGQLDVNESLNHSIFGLKSLYEKQENAQVNKWKEVGNRLNELKAINLQHELGQNYVVERLKGLESENKKVQGILETDRLSEQELMKKMNGLSQLNQKIVDQLEVYYAENAEVISRVDEQYEMQKQMADHASKQEDKQEEVLNRLENQEALTEKITRQIEYFRTILFERTNFLAEKIENGYHHTSSYIANLISNPEQPSTRFLVNQKEEEEEQKVHK